MGHGKRRNLLRRVWFIVVFVALAILFISGIAERSWKALVVVVLFTALLAAQKLRPSTTAPAPRIQPEDIPIEDVRAAVAASRDRIRAIKALREMYPGLNLKDAKDLVETQRGHP